MASSPEYDKEPKAPDKSVTTVSSEESKLHNTIHDQQSNTDPKSTHNSDNAEAENNKDVEALDDKSLQALLEEAIAYKGPKDREGKSSLFKELLEEAEQDDQASEAAAARSLGGCRGCSLQDLVAALAAEPATGPRRHNSRRHQHAPANVSTRATQGGSLPSGVDTSSLLSEEPARGAGYLATVRCVNPPPLAERRVSASDAHAPHDLELLNRRSKPTYPMTYTARATLEIGSGSVCSGRAVTTTTASNQVDSAIPFSCITTPEVVASCNTTSSTSQSAVAVDAKPLQLDSSYRAVASLTGGVPPPAVPDTPATPASPTTPHRDTSQHQPRSVIPSSFNGLPLSRPNYGSTTTTASDEYKKSLDENGNAVQGFSSPLAGSAQHKKPRRKKSSKNETVIDCRQIDGYQGDKDVNELLRFIESNAEGARAPKLGRAKHRDDADDKAGKKRSTERRKDKDKVKRATSLEEVSRTKLEDLTAHHSHHTHHSHHATVGKPERRSWGDTREPDHDDPATELTDFQTVTKKRKQRRRTDEPAPRRTRAPSPPGTGTRHQPVSAPPSERSNDSNDDLDSAHSAHSPPPAAPPAPSHASYADIARTRHNIPDLIESCNFYAEGEGEARRAADAPPPPPADTDGYPALEARAPPATTRRARDTKPPPASRRDRKERAPGAESLDPLEPLESHAADCPAPDVVADRRPPVILLDAAARPGDMDGVTFGFDINEQLLSGPARRPRCDLLRDALEGGASVGGGGGVDGVSVVAGCASLRYVPPVMASDMHHLHQIIDYVGSAWEDVVRCGGGKVRYFTE